MRPLGEETKTALFWDGHALTATDDAARLAIRVKPVALYYYSYVQDHAEKLSEVIGGLAALDADGLVLVDLPGPWDRRHVAAFTATTGLRFVDGHHDPPRRTRAVLAGRAPGWRRLHGRDRPFLSRWRAPVAICAGVVGLGVMAYLTSTGAWMAWRGLATVGRLALDLIDAKWLMIAFSPALLVLRPVMARVQRWRIRNGTVLGQAGGAHLTVKQGKLRIGRGKEAIPELRVGVHRSEASTLLLYRYDPPPTSTPLYGYDPPPTSTPLYGYDPPPTSTHISAHPLPPNPATGLTPAGLPDSPNTSPASPHSGPPPPPAPGPAPSGVDVPGSVPSDVDVTRDSVRVPVAPASIPSAVGLFVLDGVGQPLHHLPGPWDVGTVHRFAQRYNLRLAVHRVSREEYLQLVRTCREATP
ncbi:hypothetical protein [Nonomuraea sp. NPDC048916]|uniref:hypothetical protein n=1 Tax=Nonomuraea sp. NPDC048916 TaxID=3154232 RepID=UPI0033D7D676